VIDLKLSAAITIEIQLAANLIILHLLACVNLFFAATLIDFNATNSSPGLMISSDSLLEIKHFKLHWIHFQWEKYR